MKVLLINGSPHREGNTFIALSEVARTLESEGVQAEIVHIGTTTILPDEVGTVDDSLKSAPVVSAFIERGDIQIVTGKGAGKTGKGGKKAPGDKGDTEDTQGGNGDGNGSEDGGEGDKDGQ